MNVKTCICNPTTWPSRQLLHWYTLFMHFHLHHMITKLCHERASALQWHFGTNYLSPSTSQPMIPANFGELTMTRLHETTWQPEEIVPDDAQHANRWLFEQFCPQRSCNPCSRRECSSQFLEEGCSVHFSTFVSFRLHVTLLISADRWNRKWGPLHIEFTLSRRLLWLSRLCHDQTGTRTALMVWFSLNRFQSYNVYDDKNVESGPGFNNLVPYHRHLGSCTWSIKYRMADMIITYRSENCMRLGFHRISLDARA